MYYSGSEILELNLVGRRFHLESYVTLLRKSTETAFGRPSLDGIWILNTERILTYFFRDHNKGDAGSLKF